jgi:hypothetical protein
MNKNLIIVPAGDNSLHNNWLDENKNFDLIIIYYGNSDEIYEKYVTQSKLAIKTKGNKWHLIYDLLYNNDDIISQYDYVWFPDDDLDSNTESINRLFDINSQYDLWLSQPTLDGHVSFPIEQKVENSILRFTNFVEIICPVMKYDTIKTLLPYFNINESGWGLDFLWPKILGYPLDKIAIIDDVTVIHTKPVGGDYSRFKKEPIIELKEIFNKYNLSWSQDTFNTIPK